jgi:hypothetical protein
MSAATFRSVAAAETAVRASSGLNRAELRGATVEPTNPAYDRRVRPLSLEGIA